eukprot:gene1784-2716_t
MERHRQSLDPQICLPIPDPVPQLRPQPPRPVIRAAPPPASKQLPGVALRTWQRRFGAGSGPARADRGDASKAPPPSGGESSKQLQSSEQLQNSKHLQISEQLQNPKQLQNSKHLHSSEQLQSSMQWQNSQQPAPAAEPTKGPPPSSAGLTTQDLLRLTVRRQAQELLALQKAADRELEEMTRTVQLYAARADLRPKRPPAAAADARSLPGRFFKPGTRHHDDAVWRSIDAFFDAEVLPVARWYHAEILRRAGRGTAAAASPGDAGDAVLPGGQRLPAEYPWAPDARASSEAPRGLRGANAQVVPGLSTVSGGFGDAEEAVLPADQRKPAAHPQQYPSWLPDALASAEAQRGLRVADAQAVPVLSTVSAGFGGGRYLFWSEHDPSTGATRVFRFDGHCPRPAAAAVVACYPSLPAAFWPDLSACHNEAESVVFTAARRGVALFDVADDCSGGPPVSGISRVACASADGALPAACRSPPPPETSEDAAPDIPPPHPPRSVGESAPRALPPPCTLCTFCGISRVACASANGASDACRSSPPPETSEDAAPVIPPPHPPRSVGESAPRALPPQWHVVGGLLDPENEHRRAVCNDGPVVPRAASPGGDNALTQLITNGTVTVAVERSRRCSKLVSVCVCEKEPACREHTVRTTPLTQPLDDVQYNCYSPAISFDKRHLAWLRCSKTRHVSDGCELLVSRLPPSDAENAGEGVLLSHIVDGGLESSVCSPTFLQDGSLVYLCDRGCTTFSLYRSVPVPRRKSSKRDVRDDAAPFDAESAYFPQGEHLLAIGTVRYRGVGGSDSLLAAMKYAAAHQVAVVVSKEDCDALILFDTQRKSFERFPTLVEHGVTRLWCVSALDETRLAAFCAGPSLCDSLILLDTAHNTVRSLRASSNGSAPLFKPIASSPATSSAIPLRGTAAPAHGANAWLFLPPAGVAPGVGVHCAEVPVEGRVPLVIELHTGGFWGETWRPDAWHAPTQFLTSSGYAVVHVVCCGATGYGREIRRQAAVWDDCARASEAEVSVLCREAGCGEQKSGGHDSLWLSKAPEQVRCALLAANEVAPVDFHHVAMRGSSGDAFLSLYCSTAPQSLARAVIARGLIADLPKWGPANGN